MAQANLALHGDHVVYSAERHWSERSKMEIDS